MANPIFQGNLPITRVLSLIRSIKFHLWCKVIHSQVSGLGHRQFCGLFFCLLHWLNQAKVEIYSEDFCIYRVNLGFPKEFGIINQENSCNLSLCVFSALSENLLHFFFSQKPLFCLPSPHNRKWLFHISWFWDIDLTTGRDCLGYFLRPYFQNK